MPQVTTGQETGSAYDRLPAGSSSNKLFSRLTIILIVAVIGMAALIAKDIMAPPDVPRTALERDLARYRISVKERPNDPQGRLGLGVVYMEIGDYRRAVSQFKQAVKLDPQPRYRHQLARSYRMMGETATAVKLLKALIKDDPRYEVGYYELAGIYIEDRRYDEAVDLLKKAVEIMPFAADTRVLLGEAYEKSNRADLAVAEYREAIKYIPDDGKARAGLKRLGQRVD